MRAMAAREHATTLVQECGTSLKKPQKVAKRVRTNGGNASYRFCFLIFFSYFGIRDTASGGLGAW